MIFIPNFDIIASRVEVFAVSEKSYTEMYRVFSFEF
jgi:hypothetical protein